MKSLRAIKWLDILPSGLGLESTNIDDYTFEFILDQAEKVTILGNNDKNNALHILTSLPETNKPDPEDKSVLYYKAGKSYDIGVLDLKDDQILYIEGGATLKGMVRVRDAKNVKILGRGMIDGSDNNSTLNEPKSDNPWSLIYLEYAENVLIDGSTLFNSLRWTIHSHECNKLKINNIRVINWNFGSDGTDLSACQNVRITSSFYRTNDDPGFSVYPNPTRNYITIDTKSEESQEYYIYSIFGECVLKGNIESGSAVVDLADFSRKIHIIKIGSKAIKLVKTE